MNPVSVCKLGVRLLLPLLFIAACKTPPPPQMPEVKEEAVDPDRCRLAERADALWNEAVRDTLDLSVKIIEGTIEAWEAEHFTSLMDKLSAEWIARSEQACRVHFFDKGSNAETYRAQAACYDEVIATQAESIELMKNGNSEAVDMAASLLDALDACP